MGSLQSVLEEQLATMPRIIATELVRDKLQAAGHAENEKLVEQIVDQLLGTGSDEEDGDDGDVLEFETDEEIVLEFTDADTARAQDMSTRSVKRYLS